MSDGEQIWVLGSKNDRADKSFLWNEEIPNISDADVIIIDLNTLTHENMKSVESQCEEIQNELHSKAERNGTVVLIHDDCLEETIPDTYSDYDSVIPFDISCDSVSIGNRIKYKPDHEFADYLKHVKEFNYQIHDVSYLKHVEEFNYQRPDVDLWVCKENTEITDNSDNVLGGIYQKRGSKENGCLVILPPTTGIPIDEGIDKIISIYKNEQEEPSPSWIESIELPGLNKIKADLEKLKSKKAELEASIDEKRKEKIKSQRYFGLLFGTGKQLENIVMDSFKLLGFSEIKQIREKNLEDGVIEIRSAEDVKYGIIEIKGKNKKTSQKDIIQCNTWVEDYLKMNEPVKTKGVFISNQFRLDKYPNSRDCRKKYEQNELEFAASRDICIIPSYVLFEAVGKILAGESPDRNKIEKLLLDTKGVLEEIL